MSGGLTPCGLLGLDVAAEVHERLDRFDGERRRLPRVRELERAGLLRGRIAVAVVDVALDGDADAVVDRAQDRDRASVLARVTDEELSEPGRRLAAGGSAERVLAH